MLQATLDPSSLLFINDQVETEVQIVVSLAGLSWAKNVQLPREWDADTKIARQFLYPWNWDLPTHLRVYWFKEISGRYVSADEFSDLPLKLSDLSSYKEDGQELIKHYESILDEKIFFSNGGINPQELFFEFLPQNQHEIELTDKDPAPDQETKFYKGAMAEFAQKLSPLNQWLKFVFFAPEDNALLKAPQGYAGFAVFPYNLTPGSRWEPQTTMPTEISCDKPTNTEDVPWLDINYKMLGSDLMKVYCPLTPPTQKDHGQGPIRLRDKDGNFEGQVLLEVNDVEDQLPALLSVSGRFFDLPRFFWSFLKKHRETFQYEETMPEEQYRGWMTRVNQFLWTVLRDSLGFGFRKETDRLSTAERIVRKYCDTLFDVVQSLNDVQQKEYWETYYRIGHELLKNIEEQWHADSSFDSDAWTDLLQRAVFARQSEIRDIIQRVEAADGPLQQKPLQLNARIETLVLQLQTVYVPSDENKKEEIDRKVDEWLERWEKYLEFLYTDHLLQGRILFEQWFGLNGQLQSIGLDLDAALKTKADDKARLIKYILWYDELFSSIVDPRENQKEGIAVAYSYGVLRSLNESLTSEIETIAADWLNAVRQYAKERVDRTKSEFFPLLEGVPFDEPPADGFPDWYAFLAALEEYTAEIIKTVRTEIEQTFAIPPQLQIRVDKFENAGSLLQDDLNDEIAGHIVLMHRAQTIFQTDFLPNDWRYLNWAKVSSVVIKDGTRHTAEFQNPYLLPAFLPELEGEKVSFLQLSNEKLSLVAGHEDSFNDSANRNAEEKQWSHFDYKFDKDHRAYGLWYGYQYEFAGFVALNSGVLPAPLRSGQAWNIPEKSPDLSALTKKTSYHHLRRVPISQTRVEVRGKNNRPTANLPKELLPLAFELTEWKGNDNREKTGTGVSANSQVYYLLAQGEQYDQGEIVLTLRKPTTSFWNWYAWLGRDTEKPSEEAFRNRSGQLLGENGTLLDRDHYVIGENGTRLLDAAGNPVKGTVLIKSIAQVAMEKDLQKRTDLNAGLSSVDEGVCDPAIENVVFVVLDKLFPKAVPGFKKYPVQLVKSNLTATLHDLLADFKNQLPVEITGAGETDVILDDNGFAKSIRVKEGEVVRINIHSLLETSKLAKFYSWMKQVITDAQQVVKVPLPSEAVECYLTKPVEIWVEAAKPLETNTLKLKEEEALLWESMIILEDTEKVSVQLKKDSKNFETFAYLSRLEVRHQVWNWNGRLDESRTLVGNFYDEADRLLTIAKDSRMPAARRQEALERLKSFDPAIFGSLTTGNVETGAGTEALKQYAEKNALDPTPENPLTTDAMKWEAWAFSDRPDFSALIQETNLLAFRPDPADEAVQHLFADRRPAEEKALYYRFSLAAHSRYESLGAPYNQSRESKLQISDSRKNEYTIWRRHLRKCTKTKRLPKPTVRFVIPLTKSIKECTEAANIGTAAMLLVLEDHWFSEAGLAEQFEMGIEVIPSPGRSKGDYLAAGNDPILSATSLGKFVTPKTAAGQYPYVEKREGDKCVAVFEPKGPVGLTFDFAAQTPRLKGCAFIVEVPDLHMFIPVTENKQTNKLQPWSLIQIKVRRGLRSNMCKSQENIKSLFSEWSAPEWVQFLPSVDSFIPQRWQKRVATEGHLLLEVASEGRTVNILHQSQPDNELPTFDSLLEERMQRFLIVTEKVYDIGGQPCEKFVEVYWHNDKLQTFELDPKVTAPDTRKVSYVGITEGYLRLMLVRNAGGDLHEGIWQRLFGSQVMEKQAFTAVQNDPTAALPIISERIPYKIS